MGYPEEKNIVVELKKYCYYGQNIFTFYLTNF